MDLSNTPMPAGDPATQAIDSLRGYVYQLYASAVAWISLVEGEVLYLEVAKDFAVAARDALNTVEVKNTQANVTINSEDVRETLDQFVDLVARNRAQKVKLRFLTTSRIGTEQSVDHRANSEPTLSYWAKAASGGDIALLRDVLLHVKLSDRVRTFIDARNDDALRADFVQPITWDCGAPSLGQLKAQLELVLASYGMAQLDLSAEEGKRLTAAMLQRLLETAAKPSASARKLTREELHVLLDEASRVSLPRKDATAALRLIGSHELTREALERDLTLRYERALQRAPFPEMFRTDPFQSLAQDVLQGGGSAGPPELRRRILLRAARSAALRNNISPAETSLATAQALAGPDSDLSARARIAEARGDLETAIALLRGIADPDAQATLLGVLAKAKGDAHALAWLGNEHPAVEGLPANGVITWSQILLRQEDFEATEALLNTITPRQITECPYLLLLRGAVRFATLLPKPDRKLPLFGLQLDVRRVQPIYPDDDVSARLDAAARDFHELIPIVTGLELRETARLIDDYLVWFDLVHPARRAAALQKLRADMAEPGRALSRLQFAYAYDTEHFNPEPIQQYLDRREALVGLTEAELRAAFVIVTHTTDAARVAAFVARHRTSLEASYGKPGIRLVEIQALARSGKSADARALLEASRTEYDAEEVARLTAEVATSEGADPVEEYKRAYQAVETPETLRALIAVLTIREEHRSIGPYAEELYDLTDDIRDLSHAAQSYANAGDDENFLRVVEAHPAVLDRSAAITRRYGWALFNRGRMKEARQLLERYQADTTRRDLNLEIAVAIETGDWESLSQPLTAVLQAADGLDGLALIRAAHLAQASGHGPLQGLLAAAIAKGGDDPNVLLGAYTLYIEEDLEELKSEAHDWFSRAVALSGPDGPVRAFELKDLLKQQIAWNEHTRKISEDVISGDIPLVVAAGGLRTTLVDLILRNFTRNVALTDGRRRVFVPLFPGRRPPARIAEAKRVALDFSALLVLGWLGILPKVFEAFSEIVLPAGAFRELFEGRRRIREHQKSRLDRAERVQRAISRHKLKIVRSALPPHDPFVEEMGTELAGLLRTAETSDGIVLRPPPIHRPGIEDQRDADISAHAGRLADMHALLATLRNEGVVDQPTEETAKNYFDLQDKGWPASARPEPSKPLYIEGLALVYLDTVGLLDIVLSTFKEVYIDASTQDEAEALIEHDVHTAAVLRVIDTIRDVVRKAQTSGKIVFGPRRKAEESEDDDGAELSALNLIANLMQTNAAVFDDRGLNKEPFVVDVLGYRTQIVSSLDVIEELAARGLLTTDERRLLRHRLRLAGAGLVPVDAEEIVFAAERSRDVESADLKAIRESILLARRADACRFPAEIPWFAQSLHAVKSAVMQIWLTEADHKRAAALASAVLELRLQPEDWVEPWGTQTPPDWVEAANSAIISSLALPVELPEGPIVEAYNAWLEQEVLEPLRLRSPIAYRAVVGYVRTFVDHFLEQGDG
jgi:hypothetical protein